MFKLYLLEIFQICLKNLKDGRRLNKIESGLKRISPHYLNNCITEIRKNVNGFVPCHPNKSENSYDVPMEEEFHIDEIEKAVEIFMT